MIDLLVSHYNRYVRARFWLSRINALNKDLDRDFLVGVKETVRNDDELFNECYEASLKELRRRMTVWVRIQLWTSTKLESWKVFARAY